MVQVRQWIRSAKPKPQRINFKLAEATIIPRDTTPSHEMNIKIENTSKIYTDYTGLFCVRSQSGNQYIMIAYHCDLNAIIFNPFNSCADKHILLAYGSIIKRLKDCNMLVDLQILDNKTSTEYNSIIKAEWGVRY